jgi:putative hydroxymethylpyrimidine transport system substrate-binding protein
MRIPSSDSERPGGRALLAVATLVCALCLGACGSKHDALSPAVAKPFTVMLDGSPNGAHAALYAAIAHGDFRAVGLEVRLQAPANPGEPLKLLAAGKVDVAIADEPELLLARDAGLKLVSIAALVQRPLSSVMALAARHITTVAALAGKRVGTVGLPYEATELRAVLRHAGVDPASVREVKVGSALVAAMLHGTVDATLGGYWNYEAIQLRLLHRNPTVIPVDRAGISAYDGLVLVVRETQAHSDGQDLRALLQALTRGEREVRGDPAAAGSLLSAAGPSPLPRLQLESIEQTLPAAVPAKASDPFGWQEPTAWATFESWMFSQGLLRHDPGGGLPPFSNEFLPGQGI